MEQLTEREEIILQSIVQSFIASATPVGSRYLAKRFNLSMSPATIRNVMMDLEEKGYVRQPHTSAGRVPTDKGYRIYVDTLMRVERLTPPERQAIRKNLQSVYKEIDLILKKASQVLGEISQQLGVVLTPRFYQGIFERMELVPISEKKLLVVLSIRSGLVKTIMMEIQAEISRDKLDETSRILNERLSGLTLREIKDSIDARMGDVTGGDVGLIRLIIDSADFLFNFDEREEFHVGGAHKIMAQPEFSEQEKMIKLLKLIESEDILVHVLNEYGVQDKISITIGQEHKEELMKNCSLVAATYHLGNITGTLGIIGPTRMHYAKIVSLVDYVAEMITFLLNSN